MDTPSKRYAAGDASPARLRIALNGLTVYRNLARDPVVRSFDAFLEYAERAAEAGGRGSGAHGDSAPRSAEGSADALRLSRALGDLVHGLLDARRAAPPAEPGAPELDLWQAYLVDLIAVDENPFSLAAESGAAGDEAAWAARDLAALRLAFDFNLERMQRLAASALGDCWSGEPIRSAGRPFARDLAEILAASPRWELQTEGLAEYYRTHGCGAIARFHVLRWEGRDDGGALVPVAAPDPVRLSDLFAYESQRREIIDNTLRFLEGLPAQNVLLYGERGTGKSSTVKAIANEYRDMGLRLVELPRDRLSDLTALARALRGRARRFIVFVDDLSFEEQETEYKHLKSMLEGGAESRPENVLLYATSNRRHLVRERFSDRAVEYGPEGEVHPGDTVEEKMSLADRFGLTVVFPAPSQEVFLQIVRGIAASRGLDLPPAELERKALLWERWQNGRSGRSARQFVDHLVGEMASRRGGLRRE